MSIRRALPGSLGRLRVWLAVAVLCVAVAAGEAFWREPAGFRLSEQSLDLSWTLEAPLRVAVLGDLHVGSPFNGLDKLDAIVARTNEAHADVVCLLGDLVVQGVIGGRFVPPEAIASRLAALSASSTVVAVLGNHDNWLDGNRVRRALESQGIHVLENAAIPVRTTAGTIWIAGVADAMTRVPDVTGALAAVPPDAPVVLLTHSPDVFPSVPARVTLTVAGHTHGGQVRVPLLGPPIVPSRYGARYAAGHVVESGRHLFVTTGLGTSILPVRFGVPPTVDVLTLRRRQ